MKIIYLAAGRAIINHDNVVYNDFKENRDLKCDMWIELLCCESNTKTDQKTAPIFYSKKPSIPCKIRH